MTNAARDTLRRLDTILADNSEAIHSTMANLSTFTDALARNSGKLDGIVAGLERLTGGGAANAAQVVYDLTAPTQFAAIDSAARGQLVVAEPTALIALETRKFLIRPNPSDEPTFAKAEWSDNAPKLLQTKIIQTFENAGLSKTVSRPAEGLVADKQLALDIRKFQISHLAGTDGRNRVRRQDCLRPGSYRRRKSVPGECAGQSTERRFGGRGARRSLWQVCHRVGDMGCRRHVIWTYESHNASQRGVAQRSSIDRM